MTQTITRAPGDAGHKTAAAYWQGVLHVFSRSYRNAECCALCDLRKDASQMADPSVKSFASLLHVNPAPEVKPTIASLEDTTGHRSDGRAFSPTYRAKPSCGHEPVTIALQDRRYKAPEVGDEIACSDCHWEWHEANYPGLPGEMLQTINALVPHCPRCGETVNRIPFVERTVHDIDWEPDGQTGELISESMENDRIESDPDWNGNATHVGEFWYTGELTVECENKHAFPTSRLAWRHRDGTDEWMVLPA